LNLQHVAQRLQRRESGQGDRRGLRVAQVLRRGSQAILWHHGIFRERAEMLDARAAIDALTDT
jgi:hypothetical protein